MWKPSCKTHKTLAQRAAEQRSNAEGGRRKKKKKETEQETIKPVGTITEGEEGRMFPGK